MKKEMMVEILKDVQKNGVTMNNCLELEKMIADLQNEIRTANNKKCGGLSIEKIAKNIIRDAKKLPKEYFHGAWVYEGFQYVCDGFRALCIKNQLDLEPVPEKHYNASTSNALKNLFAEPAETERFQLPTVADLKSMIAEQKAAAKIQHVKDPRIAYFTGGPAINAQYLLDAITATGATELRTTCGRNGKWINPCFLSSDDCTALVLPVNAKSDLAAPGTCSIVNK